MSGQSSTSVEEQNYHQWVKNNLHYLQLNKQHISVMQKIFIDGFMAGVSDCQKTQAEEQLQK